MTISFSGLASGLDTSSWVESLVALKQAKVTTLEEEKKDVLLSRETLNNIRSFFSSFRSMIEKVTDAKFGVATMDLFAQNLANSTDLEVLTASATTEAEEASYNILVDQLASETKASSNYSYMTTIIQTTTAAGDSKLSHLGVRAGNIGVYVNGIERGINITENDTISSFIDKLKDIGVEASFNEQTGVFSVNLNGSDINDIDGTGIVNALHLEGVNEGYTSNTLQISTTDTVYSAATEDTLMSELGVNAGTITIHANDRDYNIAITNSTKLGDFIDALRANNIDVELDDSGFFTMSDAEITNQGTTNIIDALGLAVDIYGKTQVTKDLTHETIVTTTTSATLATKLADLGTGVAISDGQTVVVKNSSNETTTITVGTNTTLGELLSEMSNAGLYAALNSDGIVEIAGGNITGGTFDVTTALGLEQEPFTAMVTGNSLTETVVVHKLVDLQTRLVDDLGVDEGYLEVTDADGHTYYEKIYSGQTIADFMTDMGNLGINTSLDEETGVLTITGGAFATLTDADVAALVANRTIVEPEARYHKGTNLLECLYGAPIIATDQITVASTYSKTRALTRAVVNTIRATETTTLGDIYAVNGTAIWDVRGEQRTINITTGDTIETLMSKLEAVGIASSWDAEHSKIMIENATLVGGTSNLDDVLDLTTTISGKYATSNKLYSQDTVVIDATSATTLNKYGISNSMSAADRTVKLFDYNDNIIATMTVTETTTIGNLVDFINSKSGVSATLENGVLKITGGYLQNATLEESMGLEHTSTISTNQVSTIRVTHTSTFAADLTSTLGEIGSYKNAGDDIKIYDYNQTCIATISSLGTNSTVEDMFNELKKYGINGTINNGVISLYSEAGSYATGNLMTNINIGVENGVTEVHTIASDITSSITLTRTDVVKATEQTTLGDLVTVTSSNNKITVSDINNNAFATITVSSTTTLDQLFADLSAYDITAQINDGVIFVESVSGNIISGGVLPSLGLNTTSYTVTTTTGVTNTSTAAISYTTTWAATTNDLVGQAGSIVIYNKENQAIGTVTTTNTSTFDSMFRDLDNYGIVGTIENGVVTLTSNDGNYATGTPLTGLGIATATTLVTVTIGSTVTSTAGINYTTTWAATTSDAVGYAGSITIYNSEGQAIGTVTTTNTTTYEDLFKELDNYGIVGSIENGFVSLTSSSGNYATGGALTSIGISTTATNTTITVGSTVTSTAAISYTTTWAATTNDLVGQAGSIVIYNKENQAIGTVTTTNTSTFDSMFRDLDNYGIVGTIENGVVTLTSNDGNYATGTPLTGLGIATATTLVTVTIGSTVTSNAGISYTTTWAATTSDAVGYAGSITIYNSEGQAIGTVTTTNTTTYEDLFKELDNYGIVGSIENGFVSLTSSSGNYATGGALTSIGISTTTTNTTITVGSTVTSTAAISYTTTWAATTNDLVGQAGSIVIYNKENQAIGTVTTTNTSTFDSMFRDLDNYGIVGTIENGVVSLTSNDGNYATGTPLTGLGIATATTKVTLTVGSTVTSTAAISYTKTVSKSSTDAIGYAGNITVYNNVGQAIGTVTTTATTTFQSLFAALDNLGIQGEISDNGVVTLTSNNGSYAKGAPLTSIGVGTTETTVTVTVGTTTTSTTAITYSTTWAATTTDTVGHAGTITVKDQKGNTVGTVTVAATDSFDTMFRALDDYGIQGTIENGVVSLTSNLGYYAEGAPLTGIGISTSSFTETYTVGIQHSATVTYNVTRVREMSDAVGDTGSLEIRNEKGVILGTVSVAATDTFEAMFKKLDDYGIQGTISDGIVSLTSSVGNYVATSFLGIGTDTTQVTNYITTTIVTTSTSYTTITTTMTVGATLHDKISEVNPRWSQSEYYITVKDYMTGADVGYYTITTDTTIYQFAGAMSHYGIFINVADGVLIIDNSSSNYINGCHSDMGIVQNSHTVTCQMTVTTPTVTTSYVTNTITRTVGLTMTDTISKISNYSGYKTALIYDQYGNEAESFSIASSATIQTLFEEFAKVGIQATIDDGVISLTSNNGYYLFEYSDIAQILGIAVDYVDTYVVSTIQSAMTSTSTLGGYQTLDESSLISDYVSFSSNETICLMRNNVEINTVTITTTMTFGDLADAIEKAMEYTTDGSGSGSTYQGDCTVTFVSSGTGASRSLVLVMRDNANSYSFSLKPNTSNSLLENLFQSNNVVSDQSTKTFTVDNISVSEDTRFEELGMDSTGSIVINTTNGTRTIMVDKNKTIGSVMQELAAYNIHASLDGNKFNIVAGTEPGVYISNISSGIRTALKLGTSYYGTSTALVENTVNTPSGRFTKTETITDVYTTVTVGSTTQTLQVGDVIITNGMNMDSQWIKQETTDEVYAVVTDVYTTTTTTVTETLTSNTLSNKQEITENRSVTDQTTVGELGFTTSDNTFDVNLYKDGQHIRLSFYGDTTLGEVVAEVAGFGCSMAIASDGTIEINNIENKNAYIESIDCVAGGNYYTSKTETIYANTTSTQQNKNGNHTLHGDTTLGQLGISGAQSITVVHEGKTHTLNLTSTNTIDSVLAGLAGLGIAGSIASDGKITLQGSNDGYITAISSDLKTALKLSDPGSNVTYTTTTQTSAFNTSSGSLTKTVTHNLNGNSTLADLGVSGAQSIKVSHEGKIHTLDFATTNTVDSVIAALAGVGIAATIASDGKITFQGTNDGYITEVSSGLQTAFKVGSTGYSTTTTEDMVSNTLSTKQERNTTHNLRGESTLAQLGASASQTITVKHEGKEHTLTFTTSNTVDDILAGLGGLGIAGTIGSDGKVTLQGTNDGYITAMSDGMKSALKLNTPASGYTWTTTTVTDTANTISSQQFKNGTHSLRGETTLAQLGASASQTITVKHEGKEHTLTFTTSNTVDDILAGLGGLGIAGTIGSDGKVTLQGTNDGYITAMSDGMKTALKLNTPASGYTWTTATESMVSNTLSTQQERSGTHNLRGESTLAQLGATASQTITVKHEGKEHTLTFTTSSTVDDILAGLGGLGIAGTIGSDGKVTLQGTNDGYITAMSDGMKSALKLNTPASGYTWTTTTVTDTANTISSQQFKNGTHSLRGETTLAQLGITANQTMTIKHEGKDHTVTFAASNTLNDVIGAIAGLGIAGTISADGKLTLQGTNDGYITAMSDSLKTALKLNTPASGYTWTTATESMVSNTLSTQQERSGTHTIRGETTLAQLGVTSNQTFTVNYEGKSHTVTFNTQSTMNDVIEALAGLGIAGTIGSDGKVTLQGTNNGYITDVSAGIQSALKLAAEGSGVTWTTSTKTYYDNTESNEQTYSVVTTMSTASTLSSLGLTSNGTITVMVDGTQSVVTIGPEQTVDDMISTLAGYGIIGSVDNGKITFKGSDAHYIKDISSNLKTALALTSGQNNSWTTENRLTWVNTDSRDLTEVNTGVKIDEDTLLKSIDGFNNGNGNLRVHKTDGTYETISVNPNCTLDEFFTQIEKYGLIGSVDADGKVTILGLGDVYLEEVSGGSNILTALHLSDIIKNMDGTTTQTSTWLTDTTVTTHIIDMDMSDKIRELTDASGTNLGITAGQIYVYQDGTRSTVNIDIDDTLQTLAAKLSQYGISMGISEEGRIYFDGNNDSYLTIDGIAAANASNILSKIGVGGAWNTRYDSTSKNLEYTEDVDVKMNGSTKLKDLQDSSGNNLGITEGSYYVYSNGVRNTETITEDTTVNDFMATMAKYGLVADVNEDGEIEVGAYNDTYLATSALATANSNVVSVLFEEWNFVNIYTSNGLDIPTDEVRAIVRETKLSDINEGTYEDGYITVVKDGVQTHVSLTPDDTVGTLIDTLAMYGFDAVINEDGQLIIKNTGNSLLQNYTGAQKASNILTVLGINLNNWVNTNSYTSESLNVITTQAQDISATRDTLLSEMGVSTGEYYVFNNGVKYTALVSTDETLGSFMDTLKSFGLETSLVDTLNGSRLSVVGKGDVYLAKSNSVTNASNVVDLLFTNPTEITLQYQGLEQTSEEVTTYYNATEDTLLSEYNNGMLVAEGNLAVIVNGETNTLDIKADETIGTLLNKFRDLGLEATLSNGQIVIQSGYDTMTIDPDATVGTKSNVLATLGLVFQDDLGGYSASGDEVEATTSHVEEVVLSVSNYADLNTKLSTLNISSGFLTVYADGQRGVVEINADETFEQLQDRLNVAVTGSTLDLRFENGYLTIYEQTGKAVEVGSTTDKGNFLAITGIESDGTGVATSSRELYCVNNESKVTTTGLFRNGDVREGTFIIGDATFTITADTRLADIISQINSSDTANATAYWDNVDGKLVIKSRTTGSALLNIQAGTSNFTDVMGYTTSEWTGNTLDVCRMNVDTQEIGDNAKIKINGTTYTASSNTITSDISRIKGVTINLKGLTEGTAVTLEVERDKETLANAVSDVVDSYNELMKNVDEAIATEGQLHDETTLKLIRNQLRNIMTSSDAGTTIFRNLDSIGIGVSAASGNNLSVTNESIINLTFDKDKFFKAFDADQQAVKDLLIGSASNAGIFSKVETLVESTLQSVSGYFASTDNSYTQEVQKIDRKIVKANEDLERYRARLEAKFASMDLLIAQMQQQYSSFLTT